MFQKIVIWKLYQLDDGQSVNEGLRATKEQMMNKWFLITISFLQLFVLYKAVNKKDKKIVFRNDKLTWTTNL